MKREMCAALVLLFLAVFSLINGAEIGRACGELEALEISSMRAAMESDYTKALDEHKKAIKIFTDGEKYAAIFINRSELKDLNQSLRETEKALEDGEENIKPLYEHILSLTEGIKKLERINIDSVL